MKPRSELRSSLGEDHSKQMKLEMQRPRGDKCFPLLGESLGLPVSAGAEESGGGGGGEPKMGRQLLGKILYLFFRVRWEELEGFEQIMCFKWFRCCHKRALKQICVRCSNINGIV